MRPYYTSRLRQVLPPSLLLSYMFHVPYSRQGSLSDPAPGPRAALRAFRNSLPVQCLIHQPTVFLTAQRLHILYFEGSFPRSHIGLWTGPADGPLSAPWSPPLAAVDRTSSRVVIVILMIIMMIITIMIIILMILHTYTYMCVYIYIYRERERAT